MHKKIKLHLLVNLVAGNNHGKITHAKFAKLLKDSQISFRAQISQYPGEIIKLAKKYANNNHSEDEILVIIGGDGSFNQALNGVKKSLHPNTPLAYLPAGSGNDFARAAKLTTDPQKFLNRLLNNRKIEKVDCGSYSSQKENVIKHYFVNNYGIGFDANVVHQSNNQKMKKILNKIHLGNLIYGLNVINVLQKQDTFTATVTGADGIAHIFHDAYLVTTTNHPYFGGGVPILPKANLHSHVLDTVIVEKPSLRKFVFLFAKMLKDGSHVTDSHFHYIEGKEIRVNVKKPEYTQIDGEDTDKMAHSIQFMIDNFYLIR